MTFLTPSLDTALHVYRCKAWWEFWVGFASSGGKRRARVSCEPTCVVHTWFLLQHHMEDLYANTSPEYHKHISAIHALRFRWTSSLSTRRPRSVIIYKTALLHFPAVPIHVMGVRYNLISHMSECWGFVFHDFLSYRQLWRLSSLYSSAVIKGLLLLLKPPLKICSPLL